MISRKEKSTYSLRGVRVPAGPPLPVRICTFLSGVRLSQDLVKKQDQFVGGQTVQKNEGEIILFFVAQSQSENKR